MFVTNYFNLFSLKKNYKKIKEKFDFLPIVMTSNFGLDYDKFIDIIGWNETYVVDEINIAKYIRSHRVNNKIIIYEKNYSEYFFKEVKGLKIDLVIESYSALNKFLSINQSIDMSSVGLYLKIKDNFSKGGFDIDTMELMINIIRHNNYKGDISFIFEFFNSSDFENKYNINIERFRLIEEKISNFIADFYIINDFALYKFDKNLLDFDYSNLYGLSGDIEYENVITLKCSLDRIKYIDYFGKKTRVGIINMGFKDGYLRNYKSNIPVLINGTRLNVIGNVKSNFILVNLNNYINITENSEVVLWGESLTGEILPIHEVSSYSTNSMRKMVDISAKIVPMTTSLLELRMSS